MLCAFIRASATPCSWGVPFRRAFVCLDKVFLFIGLLAWIVACVLLGWGACFEMQMQAEEMACESRGWGLSPLL